MGAPHSISERKIGVNARYTLLNSLNFSGHLPNAELFRIRPQHVPQRLLDEVQLVAMNVSQVCPKYA